MSYQLYAEKAIHESESKFYQIIRISGGKRTVLVTHWGKNTEGATLVPRLYGQRKIEMHDSGGLSAYSSIRRTKSKRGYTAWEVTQNGSFGTVGDLNTALMAILKKEDAESVAYYLAMEESDKDFADHIIDSSSEPEPEKKEVTFESSTQEGWGSW